VYYSSSDAKDYGCPCTAYYENRLGNRRPTAINEIVLHHLAIRCKEFLKNPEQKSLIAYIMELIISTLKVEPIRYADQQGCMQATTG